MSEHDAFEVAFADLGPRMQPEHTKHESAWRAINETRAWMQFALSMLQRPYEQARQWSNSPAGIEFDVIAAKDLNALATTSGTSEVCGITAGLVVLLQEAFWALAASPRFLPGFAYDNKRWASDDEVRERICGLDLEIGWGTLSPEAGDRIQLANALRRVAELFVLCHEVSHLTYGHTRHSYFGASPSVEPIIVELPLQNKLEGRAQTASQAIELDADEGASALSIDWVMDYLPRLPPERGGVFGSAKTQTRIFLWSVAISVLCRLLDLWDSAVDLTTSGSHPPPGVRSVHAAFCARGHIGREHSADSFDAFWSIWKLAHEHISEVWKALELPSASHNIPGAELVAYAKDLRDALERMDREGLDDAMRQRTAWRERVSPYGDIATN